MAPPPRPTAITTSTPPPPQRHETCFISEAVILVPDASRFKVNERALWHLERLRKPVRRRKREGDAPSHADFEIGNGLTMLDASVRPLQRVRRSLKQLRNVSRAPSTDVSHYDEIAVVPTSSLWFVHSKYSVVFAVTLSAGMVAQNRGERPVDHVCDTIVDCMRGLARPMQSGSTQIDPSFEFFISVVAYAAPLDEVWCILQGFQLSLTGDRSPEGGHFEAVEEQMVELSRVLSRSLLKSETKICRILVVIEPNVDHRKVQGWRGQFGPSVNKLEITAGVEFLRNFRQLRDSGKWAVISRCSIQ